MIGHSRELLRSEMHRLIRWPRYLDSIRKPDEIGEEMDDKNMIKGCASLR